MGILDDIQKLEVLKNQFMKNGALESDKTMWDEFLQSMEQKLINAPSHRDTYNEFSEIRKLVESTIRLERLESYEGSIIVVSAIRGLFSSLHTQLEQHRQDDDMVIVLGNWMAFPGDVSSLQKAIELSEQGIVFLKGETEEQFLKEVLKEKEEGTKPAWMEKMATTNSKEDSIEYLFVHSLPTDVRTPNIIATTGDTEKEPIPMKSFIKGDMPNLTGRTLVVMHPNSGEDTYVDSERKLIVLAPGDATRLDLKAKDNVD